MQLNDHVCILLITRFRQRINSNLSIQLNSLQLRHRLFFSPICAPFTFVIHAFQLRTRRQMCSFPPPRNPLTTQPVSSTPPLAAPPPFGRAVEGGEGVSRLGPRFIVCLLYYKLKRNYSTNMRQFASEQQVQATWATNLKNRMGCIPPVETGRGCGAYFRSEGSEETKGKAPPEFGVRELQKSIDQMSDCKFVFIYFLLGLQSPSRRCALKKTKTILYYWKYRTNIKVNSVLSSRIVYVGNLFNVLTNASTNSKVKNTP